MPDALFGTRGDWQDCCDVSVLESENPSVPINPRQYRRNVRAAIGLRDCLRRQQSAAYPAAREAAASGTTGWRVYGDGRR